MNESESIEAENFLIKIKPEKTFNHVGGLRNIKNALKNEVKFLKTYTKKEFNFPLNGKHLFIGPPGTGKTLCAEAIAYELDWDYYELDSSLIISKYLGDTAKNLKITYEFLQEEGRQALLNKKGICFLVDELDFIAKSRTSDDMGEAKRIVTAFLKKLESSMFSETGILTIAATNHQKLLDDAAWSRFDLILKFDLPDKEDRVEILQILFDDYEELNIKFIPNKNIFVLKLAEITDQFAGRDLRSLVQYLIKQNVVNQNYKFNIENVKKIIENYTITPSSLRERYSSDRFISENNRQETLYTVFHGELNTYQYEELMIREIKTDNRFDEIKKFILEYNKFPKLIRDMLCSLDFYFLHLDNPIKYLEHLRKKSEVM